MHKESATGKIPARVRRFSMMVSSFLTPQGDADAGSLIADTISFGVAFKNAEGAPNSKAEEPVAPAAQFNNRFHETASLTLRRP